MKSITTIVLLAVCSQIAYAQDSSLLKKRLSLKIFITDENEQRTIGWISGITDSTVLVSNKAIHFGRTPPAKVTIQQFNYSQLSDVIIKRRNAVGRGVLFGGIAGIALGVGTGYIIGDDKPSSNLYDINIFQTTASEKAVLLGAAFGIVSAGIGAIIGSLSKKVFPIKSKKDKFDEMHATVLEMAYRNN